MRIQHLKEFIILLLIFLNFSVFGLEDEKGSISGQIHINQPGIIFIYLVDEQSSQIPLSGSLLTIEPSKDDVDAGFVSFLFSNLEQGTYGIRCFQDLNDNGKLDKGLFGPSEPWGFSWNKQTHNIRPIFLDYCYRVDGDVINIEIYLNE